MKKILSVTLAALMLLSMLSFTALASGSDLFDVSFDSVTKTFVVTGSDGLTGMNRVLIVVKDSSDNVKYMNAMNNVISQNVYFSVDLGNSLTDDEYTFIFSSAGDTTSSQTKTCVAEVEGDVEQETFFDVTYNEARSSFVVSGEVTTEYGEASMNRILLMVYDPMFNGYSDLYYMDALNNHKGAFSFEVPLGSSAPIGTYTFIVSSDGDVVTKGTKTCAITDNFETFGYIGQGIEFGGTYTLEQGEAVPTVIIALYKTHEDGTHSLVRTATSNEAVDGKVTAKIQIAADEDISTYSAKAFVWENLTTSLKPVKTGRSFR